MRCLRRLQACVGQVGGAGGTRARDAPAPGPSATDRGGAPALGRGVAAAPGRGRTGLGVTPKEEVGQTVLAPGERAPAKAVGLLASGGRAPAKAVGQAVLVLGGRALVKEPRTGGRAAPGGRSPAPAAGRAAALGAGAAGGRTSAGGGEVALQPAAAGRPGPVASRAQVEEGREGKDGK